MPTKEYLIIESIDESGEDETIYAGEGSLGGWRDKLPGKKPTRDAYVLMGFRLVNDPSFFLHISRFRSIASKNEDYRIEDKWTDSLRVTPETHSVLTQLAKETGLALRRGG